MTLKLKIEVFKLLLIDLDFSSGNKKPKENSTHDNIEDNTGSSDSDTTRK
jgi:hypothetical protein